MKTFTTQPQLPPGIPEHRLAAAIAQAAADTGAQPHVLLNVLISMYAHIVLQLPEQLVAASHALHQVAGAVDWVQAHHAGTQGTAFH